MKKGAILNRLFFHNEESGQNHLHIVYLVQDSIEVKHVLEYYRGWEGLKGGKGDETS